MKRTAIRPWLEIISYQHDAAHAQQRSYAIHAAESFSSQLALQPALYPLNRKFRVSATQAINRERLCWQGGD